MADIKAHLKTPLLTFEITAPNQVEMFKALAETMEVFAETKCGLCGGTSLRYVVRQNDDNEFPELHCLNQSCRARLSFGLNKKGGGMFPIRKLTKDGVASRKDGKYGSHMGWSKAFSNIKEEED